MLVSITPPVAKKISVHVEHTADVRAFGCHASMVNNVQIMVTNPLVPADVKQLGGFVIRSKLTFQQLRAAGLQGGKAYPSIDPTIVDADEYMELLPEKFKKGGSLHFQDLPEESKRAFVLHQTLLWGTCNTFIFAPVINYGKPSRGALGAGYQTAEVIRLLMKYGGGSWYGLPVMRNTSHSVAWGNMSLFQPIVWNRIPTNGHVFKGTRFEHHSDGSKFGPLIDLTKYITDVSPSAKDLLSKPMDELRSMAFVDLKKLSEELKKK